MSSLPKDIQNIIDSYGEKYKTLEVDTGFMKVYYTPVSDSRVQVVFSSDASETIIDYMPLSLCKRHFVSSMTYFANETLERGMIGHEYITVRIGSISKKTVYEDYADETTTEEAEEELKKLTDVFDFLGHIYH